MRAAPCPFETSSNIRCRGLGFGADALVVAPESLAREVFVAADQTRRRYLRPLRNELRFAMIKAG